MVVFDGVGNDGEAVVELPLELREVADVIDAFVETADEFGRDGLNGNFFITDGGEDDEQFGGELGFAGFVHGNLSDEVPGAFGIFDMPIELARLADGQEIFEGGAPDVIRRNLKRAAQQFGMRSGEVFEVIRGSWPTDPFRNVHGEKIRASQETIDGF